MQMGSLINLDLEMYPDILEMLDGVSVGDTVSISGSFQVKELSEKKFSGSFSGEDISITSEEIEDDEDEDEEYEDQGEEDEESPVSEEAEG